MPTNLDDYVEDEDKEKFQQLKLYEEKQIIKYLKTCTNPVSIDTIPDWLSDKTGINNGDIVDCEHQTEKALMVTKMKPPHYLKVVCFEIWLPKSQIDFSKVQVDSVEKRVGVGRWMK